MQTPATRDVRLLAIAGPPVLDARSLVEACRAAEAGGVTAVQLRWKRASAADVLRAAEALVRALAVPVYVNDRADVAWASGAAGVHLGADDVPPARVRAVAPAALAIGVSVGTVEEAQAAMEASADYWSVGAVYATSTKPDAGRPIGISGFQDLARHAPAGVPVIAIGGIDASNAADVVRAGAAGIAVSRAVFGAPDVERAAHRLRRALDDAVAA